MSGNALKILAMLAMTADHVGVFFFPGHLLFRIIGRLAMPIYAYLIAEGCRHTRSKLRYLGRLFFLGLACQLVYFFSMRSLYQCILITFSLSVCLIILADLGRKRGDFLPFLLALVTVWFLCEKLPGLRSDWDFSIDYGFWGVLLPVLVYLSSNRWEELLVTGWMLVFLSFGNWNVQWWSLLSLPLLYCYNGQRGKWKLGILFYLYYPLHLGAIYGLSMLLE